MKIAGTHWADLAGPQGKRFATTWDKLVARLSVPRVCATKRGIPGFALTTFAKDYRLLANVERTYAIGLDLDHLDALSVNTTRPDPGEVVNAPDWETLRRTFAASTAFVHTTYSSSLQLPRLRVFLLLSRPVSAGEYRRVYSAVAAECECVGLVVDRQASDPSRLWYCPAVRAQGASFVSWACTGAPIDVESALAASPPRPPSIPAPAPPFGGSQFEKARAYISRCQPAVAGSGGHRTTFDVAQRMVHGFGLQPGEAFALMCEWNQRCSPPWSEREIRHKVEQALTAGRMGPMSERSR